MKNVLVQCLFKAEIIFSPPTIIPILSNFRRSLHYRGANTKNHLFAHNFQSCVYESGFVIRATLGRYVLSKRLSQGINKQDIWKTPFRWFHSTVPEYCETDRQLGNPPWITFWNIETIRPNMGWMEDIRCSNSENKL